MNRVKEALSWLAPLSLVPISLLFHWWPYEFTRDPSRGEVTVMVSVVAVVTALGATWEWKRSR